MLPLARRMLADADTARRTVAEIVGLRRGRVRIGATPSLCIGVLADVLRVFHEQHPDDPAGADRERSQPLVTGLVRGDLDIALVIVPQEGIDPTLRPNRSCASGCPSPPRHRGHACPTADRSGCASSPAARWCCPAPGYDMREVALRAFADAGGTPRIAVQGGEMDAVLRLVEAGTGVAVVPDLVFTGRPRLRRTVLTPPLYRTVALARRADLAPPPAVIAFADTLVGHLADDPVQSAGDVQVLHPGRTGAEVLGSTTRPA